MLTMKQIKNCKFLIKSITVMILLVYSILITFILISRVFGKSKLNIFIDNDFFQEAEAKLRVDFLISKNSGYLVQNKGCQIPAMDPHDHTIKKYIKIAKPIKCKNENYSSLIESNNTAIFINYKSKELYYNKTKADCCWQKFWRNENNDYSYTFEEECHKFENSVDILDEFVKVECSRNNETIYQDYHAFLPRKSKVEERIEKVMKNREKNHLSLLIIGLDSVSRLNFHRMMPKSVKALQDLGAVEMLGYNKVGENTYPNLVPVLTGLSSEEVEKTCWKSKDSPFDSCPFIWKNFSSAGYRTIFAEDACSITTFNYLKPGFHVQPTDYYLRPFCIAAENEIGNNHELNTNLCLGARKNFQVLLQYSYKTAVEFKNDPYFAFFWQTSLTHDYLEKAQLGDDSYSELISNLKKNNLLEKTALIVMSDHGIRWGSFRQTYQGRVEDSLPFVFLVLPEWWKEKFPSAWVNLRRNAKSLTTAYDLHETLMDLNTQELTEEKKKERERRIFEKNTRGISWFLPIPDFRTCSMAGIPEHWCMCHGNKKVSLNNSNVQNTAIFLVQELNRMLGKFPQCANLKLKHIIDATMLTNEEKLSSNETKKKEIPQSWFDYTITLETEPGNAIFEGSIRYRNKNKNMQLTGAISRLNSYGKQSACINDYQMRLYCYCT
ncbi:uncharacterized protein LOC122511608 [Leptopilina heterotoma]|uniref:uncharacterized protein LOC122511608 n=1 Tax=Leptopilina heterotoma TaxID=63436 RepID=UPI001CA8D72A|nr:uncharacterized protein LOC122511608 [Leptopilina heterotoma]